MLPAKTSIRIDALLDATQRNLEAAKQNAHPSSVVDSVLTCLLEGIAFTLLNPQQQAQIRDVLDLWKECSSSANLIEIERPDVLQPRQAK
jgi:hypothetical protein